MRRSFLAVVIALIFVVLVNITISNSGVPWLNDKNMHGMPGEIVIVLGGIIAGYIASKKGWLHGLVTGALPYLLILLVTLSAELVFKFVLHAVWTGGNPEDIWSMVIKPLIQLGIVGGLLGCFGGITGESIHKYLNTLKHRVTL